MTFKDRINKTNSKAKASKSGTSSVEELKLTEDQKPKFQSIQQSLKAKWAELQTMDPEQRKPQQQPFFKARNEELARLLTPEQMAKYREIRQRRNQLREPSDSPSSDDTHRHCNL